MRVLLLLAVLITWQDNSDNENGFFVERTTNQDCSTGFEIIGYVGMDVTSFTDPMSINLSCYRVAAYNDLGASYSNIVQYVAPPPPPCKPKGSSGKCK